MSALTDLFTSLANKIRSKLGTSTTYTPAQAVAAIDDVYTKGVADTKVGDAGAGDVLSGKIFTNSSTVGESGSMVNRGGVTQSLNTSTTSYTIPEGYHNGSGTVSISTQEKSVTAGTSAASVIPDSGKVLSKVTYNPTPSQTKSASPSTSAQTISPDNGKLLSSVSISAISPQRSAGVAATTSGRDSTGPYVYFPYGWHPNTNSTYGNYTRLTEAQAVAVANKQEKTVTSSRSAQTVTPDSNKLLSKVTVNGLAPTGTYTASSRGASLDMGATSNYRYVNTNSVPNSNSGTYTPSSNGTALDMGATNTYRYVNTSTVYYLGRINAFAYNISCVINMNSTGANNPFSSWKNDWNTEVIVLAVASCASAVPSTMDLTITCSGTNTVYGSYDSGNGACRLAFKIIKLSKNTTVTIHTWADPVYTRREIHECYAIIW